MKYLCPLVCLLFLLISACSEEDVYPTANNAAPECPAGSNLQYVGCWEDPVCRFLPVENQWRIVRYYLTADGKFYYFTWAYEGQDCTGQVLFTDNKIVKSTPFEYISDTVNPATGLPLYSLSFNFEVNEIYKVLAEVNLIGQQICFSKNLTVHDETRFFYENGVEIDYANCLAKVQP